MADYYDSWSANKKNRNPTRPRRLSSSNNRPWTQHQQQSSSVLASTNSAESTAPTSLPSPRICQTDTPTNSRSLFSPVLPYYTSDTTKKFNRTRTASQNGNNGTGSRQRPLNSWRFPKALFDAYETDFDDTDDDDGDDDNEDDSTNNDDNKVGGGYKHRVYSSGSQNNVHPRSSVVVGSTGKPSLCTPTRTRPMQWTGHRPNLVEALQRRENGVNVENIDAYQDPLSPTQTSRPMARSSPPLSAVLIDQPSSTATFSGRLFSHSIQRGASDPDAQATINRREGRRARPWSQVIWESPVMRRSSQQHQLQPRLPRGYEHISSMTAHDAQEKEEHQVGKSVRINIDGDATNTTLGSDPMPNHSTLAGNQLLSTHSRREFSNGRRHMNRLSLGSGFYASIEPVSLSAATPSTPKSRRNLVKLPMRPQSVLIPSGSYQHHGVFASGLNGQEQGHNILSLTMETPKRRRYQSQQLDLSTGAPAAAATPRQKLAPMGEQEGARTTHGIGYPSSTLSPTLEDGVLRTADALVTGDSDPTLGVTQEQHSRIQHLPEAVQKPSWLSKAHPFTFRHSPIHQRHSQSSVHQSPARARSVTTPSRFLPALFEGQPSVFLERASISTTSSSPKANTTGTGSFAASPSISSTRSSTNSPKSATTTSSTTTHHSHQQHSYQHSPLQTRTSLPTNTTPSRSRRILTTSSGHSDRNCGSNDSYEQMHNDNGSSNHNCNDNGHRSSTLFNATRFSSWKRNSSAFFPFSLVSYESGGLLGEIKNTSTTVCTNAPSSIVAPGTPIPPGVVVSTGIPTPPMSAQSIARSIPTAIAMGSDHTASPRDSHGLSRPRIRFDSTIINWSKRSTASTASEQSTTTSTDASLPMLCQNCGRRISLDGSESSEEECCWCSSSSCSSGPEERRTEKTLSEVAEAVKDGGQEFTTIDDSIVVQKSHVAVYEINPRWGSRLMMFLATVGGVLCTVSGGLCAEHHCKDLQLCQDGYQGHGDWCGPSGVEGAPYMLTVGLSMCIFGFYALVYLRSPISRLVGYSEINQFLG